MTISLIFLDKIRSPKVDYCAFIYKLFSVVKQTTSWKFHSNLSECPLTALKCIWPVAMASRLIQDCFNACCCIYFLFIHLCNTIILTSKWISSVNVFWFSERTYCVCKDIFNQTHRGESLSNFGKVKCQKFINICQRFVQLRSAFMLEHWLNLTWHESKNLISY